MSVTSLDADHFPIDALWSCYRRRRYPPLLLTSWPLKPERSFSRLLIRWSYWSGELGC